MLLAADLTPTYTQEDLLRYERLIALIRGRVARLQTIVDHLTTLDGLDEACSTLDEMMETLALFEAERLRILAALTR